MPFGGALAVKCHCEEPASADDEESVWVVCRHEVTDSSLRSE